MPDGTTGNSGYIFDQNNVLTFLWVRAAGNGEIYGSVERTDGTLLQGCSGFYGTDDPVHAAREAFTLADGLSQTVTNEHLRY